MKNSFKEKLKNYLVLFKIKVMIPVSLTGFTGYFIFDPHFSINILFISIGILLLAISASILNQLQEVELDRTMNRTQNRPLPAKKISKKNAFLFFLVSLGSGTFCIYFFGNFNAAFIGLITLAWYNGIYTYAKRFSAFAVVPGAVTGALPPLIGWVAAGGFIWDKPIIFLEFLFFTGQIPHFWLLVIKYGEDYKNAGIPNLSNILSRSQINRLTFTWVLVSIIAALFLCYFEIIQSKILVSLLLIASFLLIWKFKELVIDSKKEIMNKQKFIFLNLYFLLILFVLVTDKIIE